MIKEEKELYDFLSQPNEFEQALIVMECMPKLRWYLLDQFWGDVRSQLEQWVKNDARQWQFEERERHQEYWNLSFTKPAWPAPKGGWHVAVCWSVLGGKPVLGLWVAEDTPLYDYPKLRDRLASLETLVQEGCKDITIRPSEYPAWWPVMYRPGLDLSESNYRGLSRILPTASSSDNSQSGTLATHFAKLTIDWLSSVEDAMETIIAECKNKNIPISPPV